MSKHDEDRSRRVAQHRLATRVVELVHGSETAEAVRAQHTLLFQSGSSLQVADIRGLIQQVESGEKHIAPSGRDTEASSAVMTLPRSLIWNQTLGKILYHAGLVNSKGKGQRMVNSGGAYFGRRSKSTEMPGESVLFCSPDQWNVADLNENLVDQDLLVLRAGKQKIRIVKIMNDDDFRARGLSCPGWES